MRDLMKMAPEKTIKSVFGFFIFTIVLWNSIQNKDDNNSECMVERPSHRVCVVCTAGVYLLSAVCRQTHSLGSLSPAWLNAFT